MKLDNPFVFDARVMKEANSLGQNGWEVVIIAKPQKGLPEIEKSKYFTVKRIKKRSRMPLWDIIRALYQERAEIYHAHDIDSLAACFLMKLLHPRAKLIYDSHEYWRGIADFRQSWKRKMIIRLESLLVKPVDLLISENKTKIKAIKDATGYKGQSIYLLNTPKFSEHKSLLNKKENGKLKFVHSGGIQRGRGADLMLNLMGTLGNEYELYLIGQDNYPEGIQAAISALGLDEKVHYLGTVAPDKVVKSISFADAAFVITEPTCGNNMVSLPNKIFEAIQAELPVISNDISPIANFVNENKLGIIVDFNNLDEAMAAVKQFRGQVEQVRKQILLAKNRYNWEAEEVKLLRAYSNLVKIR